MTVFGRVARPRPGEEDSRGGGPGFADGRRENADPAAVWPSTRRGRLRTVASPCQDRHVGGGGGLAGRTGGGGDGRARRSQNPTAPVSRRLSARIHRFRPFLRSGDGRES